MGLLTLFRYVGKPRFTGILIHNFPEIFYARKKFKKFILPTRILTGEDWNKILHDAFVSSNAVESKINFETKTNFEDPRIDLAYTRYAFE